MLFRSRRVVDTSAVETCFVVSYQGDIALVADTSLNFWVVGVIL